MIRNKNFIGLGIAGNFAGHLEQAGESDDFKNVEADQDAPKGIFPWYVANLNTFLGTDPLSTSILKLPEDTRSNKVQVEPEICVEFTINYGDNNRVTSLVANRFTVFNDASTRVDQPKISLKKNWGKNSQGIGSKWLNIDEFSNRGIMGAYTISSYLVRDRQVYKYGETSTLNSYSYMYSKLVDWTIDRLNYQKDQGPLENLSEFLTNKPELLLLNIGATRYTEFGESTYLKPGDEIYVMSYPSKFSDIEIDEFIRSSKLKENESLVYLKQKVV